MVTVTGSVIAPIGISIRAPLEWVRSKASLAEIFTELPDITKTEASCSSEVVDGVGVTRLTVVVGVGCVVAVITRTAG